MTKTRLKWRGIGLSDVGCMRENNEDAYYMDNRSGLYVVADGMGGVDGGEVASQIVISELPGWIKHSYRKVRDISNKRFEALFQENVHTLSDFIHREGMNRQLPEMGSTFVLAHIKDRHAFIAHMGDSRCYLIRDHALMLLTQDHVASESSHELTRVMGSADITHADTRVVDVQPGDKLMLCSDGLNHMLDDDSILRVVNDSADKELCRNLINSAKEAGGEDNITVIVVSNIK